MYSIIFFLKNNGDIGFKILLIITFGITVYYIKFKDNTKHYNYYFFGFLGLFYLLSLLFSWSDKYEIVKNPTMKVMYEKNGVYLQINDPKNHNVKYYVLELKTGIFSKESYYSLSPILILENKGLYIAKYEEEKGIFKEISFGNIQYRTFEKVRDKKM